MCVNHNSLVVIQIQKVPSSKNGVDDALGLLSHNLYFDRREGGKQIGVTRDYPITVTSIGYLFLFRVVGPEETSPVT
jgi:hypothetical protein